MHACMYKRIAKLENFCGIVNFVNKVITYAIPN